MTAQEAADLIFEYIKAEYQYFALASKAVAKNDTEHEEKTAQAYRATVKIRNAMMSALIGREATKEELDLICRE